MSENTMFEADGVRVVARSGGVAVALPNAAALDLTGQEEGG